MEEKDWQPEQTMIDESSEPSLKNLTRAELNRQYVFVENKIINGLKRSDSFDLLEAESTLMRVGGFPPSEELVETILAELSGDNILGDFDLLRIAGYLFDNRVKDFLEERFLKLEEIWKEQDTLRLAESYKTMLQNVARRASELSALKVAADPYLNTMDKFFESSFSEKNLNRFPKLMDIRDSLFELRQEGALSKENLLTVLGVARNKIDELIDEKTAEYQQKFPGTELNPNKVIALYYCLLEALIGQKSEFVKVNDSFLSKVSQDFRAAMGPGTKRYVLSTLLRFNHPGFAEIAAEARFNLRHTVIEKVERKEKGDPEFKYLKVDLNEGQLYELYRVATEVIASNPNEKVFETLLRSYNNTSLLMGLRALKNADLKPITRLEYIRMLLDLGTVNDYVFASVIDVLSDIDIPAAKGLLFKIICERYGWRKVRFPEGAFLKIVEGIYRSTSSAEIFALAENMISPEQEEDLAQDKTIGYPYEGKVYDIVFSKIKERFEKNPFHGINEMAQDLLFQKMLIFVFQTSPKFAYAAKKRILTNIRRLNQVSRDRLNKFIDALKEALTTFLLMREHLNQDEKAIFRDLGLEAKRTISMLTTYRGTPPKAQEFLHTLNYAVSKVASSQAITLRDLNIETLLDEIINEGLETMEERDANITTGGMKRGYVDEALLSINYPASSRAILRATANLKKVVSRDYPVHCEKILLSLGMSQLPRIMPVQPRDIAAEETIELWQVLKDQLKESTPYQEVLARQLQIARITHGCAKYSFLEILEQLQYLLLNSGQPRETRLAMMLALPMERRFATIWRRALASETEAVLYVLKNNLGYEKTAQLKEIVPELMDMLD